MSGCVEDNDNFYFSPATPNDDESAANGVGRVAPRTPEAGEAPSSAESERSVDKQSLSVSASIKPYYKENGIEIYLGDCQDILPLLQKADVTITDPPYEKECHNEGRRVQRSSSLENEPLEFKAMTEALRAAIVWEIAKKTSRWLLTFCQIEAAPIWRKAYEKYGVVYRRTMIWVKPDGLPQLSGDGPGQGFETILAMHKDTSGRDRWNGGGRTGVFIHNKSRGGEPNLHQTQKPITLMKELVKFFSDEGETILDPFCGSGSTLVAARELNRKAIGIEIEERYCEIAVKRLSQGVLEL